MDLRQNIPLRDFSNYKIGGPAKFFVEVDSVDELRKVLSSDRFQDFTNANKTFILGKGTNVLINDNGFDGFVIHNKILGIDKNEDRLSVGSGVEVKDLLDYCIDASLSGLEWAGGLPGTLGGAVRGNAGAFGKEIKDSIFRVESINLRSLKSIAKSSEECSFGYRDSVFKSKGGVREFITSVTLNLEKGEAHDIKREMQYRLDYRKNRHPIEYPNIGSIFKNIPFESLSKKLQEEFAKFIKTDPFAVVPVTKLLALAGLRGRKVGGAMISEKHPNFIINIDNASSEDVKALIGIAKQAIVNKYGLILEEEIMYL
jgi:UDP-N-acetylmuramate dehydrogenase